ncbi:response regulator transcription factor [Neobacillus niacini]|uniref:response regulator transcription factor n=1 Tax=Neobacillus niacini TaxID=86668 RepID=UPI00069494B7|nr:helix-turn-helix domain-containing protein [Neobacillus niacini]
MEALQLLSEQPFDVVLSDIRMPEMSGLELAAELHRMRSETIVVLLSGYKEFDYAQRAIEYGVRRFLLKPTKHIELTETFSQIRDELLQVKQKVNVESLLPQAALFDLANVGNQNIQMIIKYIDQNFKVASLESLADQMDMNPSYLSTFFKEKTGVNFSDYLTHIRMKNAVLLLQNSHYKTYEISELVGYSTPKNFTRKFSSYFGKSPREFRNLL